MPPPPKKTDSSRDLDRDGDVDLADNTLKDLNRDGRINSNDREENDLDNDQDIDAADHALKAGLGEKAQSVGAALGLSKSGPTWSKPQQNIQQPPPGPKIG